MFFAVLLTLLLAAPLPAHSSPLPAAPLSLRDALSEIAALSPRPEGSPAEKELVAWLKGRLASDGVEATTLDFSESDFAHSFSTCLRIDIPGESRDSLIVAVPLNTPPEAGPQGDGSVNIALALDLIAHVKRTTPPLSLTVLFLGAEHGDGVEYPMGSRLFLRDFQPDSPTAVMYLNLRGGPSRLVVRAGGRGIVTPYWLMNRCMDALRGAGLAFRLPGDELQLFRMGTTDERTAIEPWLEAGYPAVGLESTPAVSPETSEDAWAESLASFLRGFVAAGAAGVPEEWDLHYLLLQIGGASLIVNEKAFVTALLVALCAGFLYALLFRRGLRKYLRTLARNSPAVVPLAGLSFLFLAAGTYALQAILLLRGFPRLWTYAPLEFLALKACVALFLYAALYNVVRRLPVPRNGSFYSAAALFFLLVDIIVVATFNISFTFYFVWAFVFVLFSTVAPNRYAKVLLFLPAPFWGLRGVIAVFQSPALPFCRFILLSPLWGNLLVAGACLPFILVLLRLGRVFPGRGLLRRRVRELVLAGLLVLAGAALVVHLMTFTPFSSSRPQPVTATQIIDVDSSGMTVTTTLNVESPAPLGILRVSPPEMSLHIPPASTAASLPLPGAASPLTVRLDARQFLKQRNLSLRLSMPMSPRVLSISLTSDEDFILIDSSFPSIRESPREYRLLVGAFPPDPLDIELSLPTGGAFLMTVDMEFDAPLIGVSVAGRPDARVSTTVRVVRRLELIT